MTRKEFEQFLASEPYAKDLYRWPNDDERYACPGQYRDYPVQLAWEVLQEAKRRKKMREAAK